MRLRQYIIESNYGNYGVSFEGVINELFKKSYPFIKELVREIKHFDVDHSFLLSGRDNREDFFLKKVRQDRDPMDISQELQELIDDEFYKEFKIHPRSTSIFCTGRRSVATNYGNPYMVFPVNKYTYLWSKHISDLFTQWVEDSDNYISNPDEFVEEVLSDELYNKATEFMNNDIPDDLEEGEEEHQEWIDDHYSEYEEYARNEMVNEIEQNNDDNLSALVNKYTDKHLGNAIISGNEIMVQTKSVLMVDYDLYHKPMIEYFNKNGSTKPTKDILKKTFKNPDIYGVDIYEK